MATTKKPAPKKAETRKVTKKAKPRDPAEVTYRGEKYTLLEEENGKCKLTDGMIHFWVKAKDVEG